MFLWLRDASTTRLTIGGNVVVLGSGSRGPGLVGIYAHDPVPWTQTYVLLHRRIWVCRSGQVSKVAPTVSPGTIEEVSDTILPENMPPQLPTPFSFPSLLPLLSLPHQLSLALYLSSLPHAQPQLPHARDPIIDGCSSFPRSLMWLSCPQTIHSCSGKQPE